MKRRDILTRAPLALAAIGAPAAAGELRQNFAHVPENPRLIELGRQAQAHEKAYQDALATWRASWIDWSPKWPLAPDCCVDDYRGVFSGEIERNLKGAGLVREGKVHPMRVYTVEQLERRREHMIEVLAKDDRRKRKASKKTRAYWQSEVERCDLGLELLPAYLAETQRIKDESRFPEIDNARHRTARDLFAVVRQVLSEPSHTIQGVKIKAEAAAAIGRLNSYDRLWSGMDDNTRNEQHLAALLAESLIAVA
ncbi:hypothetical protein [Paracoccus saliphilus]|uniref:Uncharacterized protein n=1 Tax=Paracoccus saliphilus TaxID=405559 RepID=A0AA45W1R0_9RHOB|nr:hypothetical protein [Paracoccus saliphilus]WCR03752.1 hypothetical protein JHX88_03000 [Paracoccus saliphilus]SIS58988.1 hypothetical protein SAMN05421772_101675 [Paracoccus saliphilus]